MDMPLQSFVEMNHFYLTYDVSAIFVSRNINWTFPYVTKIKVKSLGSRKKRPTVRSMVHIAKFRVQNSQLISKDRKK